MNDELKYGDKIKGGKWFFKHCETYYYYRQMPVPHIHKGRGGRCHRNPKTTGNRAKNGLWTAELEDIELENPEVGNLLRHIRLETKDQLPNSWDDIIPASIYYRGWKNNRNHQWKNIKERV